MTPHAHPERNAPRLYHDLMSPPEVLQARAEARCGRLARRPDAAPGTTRLASDYQQALAR